MKGETDMAEIERRIRTAMGSIVEAVRSDDFAGLAKMAEAAALRCSEIADEVDGGDLNGMEYVEIGVCLAVGAMCEAVIDSATAESPVLH